MTGCGSYRLGDSPACPISQRQLRATVSTNGLGVGDNLIDFPGGEPDRTTDSRVQVAGRTSRLLGATR